MRNCYPFNSLICFAWFISVFLITDARADSELSLEISATEAHVGDPIQVRLFIPDLNEDQVTWPPVRDTLGDLLVLDADTAKAREIKKQGGASITWTVAAYDTGSFSTGDLEIITSEGNFKVIGGIVNITSVLSDTTATDLKPLKTQEELPYTWRDLVRIFGPYVLGLIIIVALYILWKRWMRNRKGIFEGIDSTEPPIPPYDQALLALRDLKKDNPLAKGDLKGYVSAISEISKRLLIRVHNAPILEMTTYELKKWLNENKILADKNEFLAILEDGDKVKFAKGVLDLQRCDEILIGTEEFIESYKPQPVQDQDNIIKDKTENRKSIKETEVLEVDADSGGEK